VLRRSQSIDQDGCRRTEEGKPLTGTNTTLPTIKADDDSKARIIAAARHSFASVGFEGASTRRIAEAAGVARSLLLYQFGSKDALWRAAMNDLYGGIDPRMSRPLAVVGHGPIVDRLMAIVTAFIALCAEDADIHRIMTVEGRRETDRLKWLVETHLWENYLKSCTVIREGQAAGWCGRATRARSPT